MWIYSILAILRREMLLLNVTLIAFLVSIFVLTPEWVVRQSRGIHFVQEMSSLPAQPWTLWIAVIALIALLTVSILHRNRKIELLGQGGILISWLEPMLCLMIVLVLHLDYNGLLLFVVVDLIDTLRGRRRWVFISAMAALYLITSLETIQSKLRMVPVEEYLTCYSTQTRQMMQSMIGVLGVMNLILFIGYMVLLVGQRTEENTAIRRLNGELEHANDRLSVMNEQLKAYAAASERMAETRERNRLAREIHDTLGHALTGITAGADACIQMMERSPELARRQMELIAATARHGISEVRRSVSALRPDALERFQLADALKQLCDEIQETSHAVIELNLATEDLQLSPDEEDTVYRTVQESITNAIRHGQATEIWIEISCTERRLRIVIQDNGIGCKNVKPGFGLRHMRERLNLLNGTLKWKGNNGFWIEAIIPLRWGDKA